MAKDLILKHSTRNWSRDLDDIAPIPNTPKHEAAIDAKVKKQTAKLAAVKAAADKGDKKAQKKWGKICKKVAKIQKAANAGNPDAVKQMAKISATGLFAAPVAMKGDDKLTEIVTSGDDKLTEILTSGAFVGRDEILGKDEILGRGKFVGEEEKALAAEGGACERAALKRRFGKRTV